MASTPVKTFDEYQAAATTVPLSLRNNRDRIDLSVIELQQEAGKVGSLFTAAFSSGKFILTDEQRLEIKDRLSDVLWCVSLLCTETGSSTGDLATHSISRLNARMAEFDPDQR